MTERFNTAEKYAPQLGAIHTRYGKASEQSLLFHTSSLDHQLGAISEGSFVEYQEKALEAGGLMEYSISANTPEVARMLKLGYANGLAAVAVKIISADIEEKSNLQKHKELLWVHQVAQKIKNRTVQHLTEQMMDDISLTPKERLIKFKEDTEYQVVRYIKEKKEEFNKWKDSPTIEKLKAPAEFAITAALSIIAAEKAPDIVNAENVMKAHALSLTARSAIEIVKKGVRTAEMRFPKFAAISEKLAAKKAVSNTFGLLKKFGFETNGEIDTISDILDESGHLITKIQTSAPIMGLTAGVIIHDSAQYLQSISGHTGSVTTQTNEQHSKTPTPSHTPESHSTPKTPEANATSTPESTISTPDTTNQTHPEVTNQIPQEESHQISPNNENFTHPIQNQPEVVHIETTSHTVNSHETVSQVMLGSTNNPYGEDLNRFILANEEYLTDPSRPGSSAATELIRLLKSGSSYTWQSAINGSYDRFSNHDEAIRVSKLYSEALKVINPGDLLNIPVNNH